MIDQTLLLNPGFLLPNKRFKVRVPSDDTVRKERIIEKKTLSLKELPTLYLNYIEVSGKG